MVIHPWIMSLLPCFQVAPLNPIFKKQKKQQQKTHLIHTYNTLIITLYMYHEGEKALLV